MFLLLRFYFCIFQTRTKYSKPDQILHGDQNISLDQKIIQSNNLLLFLMIFTFVKNETKYLKNGTIVHHGTIYYPILFDPIVVGH